MALWKEEVCQIQDICYQGLSWFVMRHVLWLGNLPSRQLEQSFSVLLKIRIWICLVSHFCRRAAKLCVQSHDWNWSVMFFLPHSLIFPADTCSMCWRLSYSTLPRIGWLCAKLCSLHGVTAALPKAIEFILVRLPVQAGRMVWQVEQLQLCLWHRNIPL